jgi:hypothetical protein
VSLVRESLRAELVFHTVPGGRYGLLRHADGLSNADRTNDKAVKDRADAYAPSQEYEKTRYPQFMGIAGKALMELTNSALPAR